MHSPDKSSLCCKRKGEFVIKRKAIPLVACALVIAFALTGCGESGNYTKAMSMYENGQYTEAADKFSALGDYEDSQNMVKACNYEAAKVLFNDGSYEEAKQAFSELGDYEDSAQFVAAANFMYEQPMLVY